MDQTRLNVKSSPFPNKIHGKFQPNELLPPLIIKQLVSIFIVPDDCQGQKILFEKFVFGYKRNNLFILNPYEVFFLNQIQTDASLIHIENFRNPSEIGGNDSKKLWNYCCSLFPPTIFPIQYAVYHFFRCRFWVVRDGSIFGALFVLYPDHPNLVHSSFTVSLIYNWQDIKSIAPTLVRINSGIKKSAIVIKVIVPDAPDFTDPNCISSFLVEAVSMNRLKIH